LTSVGEGVVEEVDSRDSKTDDPREEFERKRVRERVEN
jgi:hypothetical protein